MEVQLNGELQSLDGTTTIRQLVLDLAGQERGVAVAVDGTVLPLSRWEESIGALEARSIDILTAVQGG
ncbi:MAG: sulfur carrier protein ThiS [Corynebacterium sp.]|nr:sulfur carrier protein ThiS [Corynebacterium sp.]